MTAVGLRSSRNRELGLLLLVAAVVAVGFTSVLVARSGVVSTLSLTYAAAFLELLGIAHGPARGAPGRRIPCCCRRRLLVAVGIVRSTARPDARTRSGDLARRGRRLASSPYSRCSPITGCSSAIAT